eukprot:TRINITY_DN8061_c0_g1_i1.p1 TRINITY_DN8061_c0_g1~~TRINITY_DN8061_c0_g1_i1.p1  ORF type:complete len:264 (+),score=39.11 TRINITY_DN8061_c0_g1_i1:90-881(+)
MRGTLSQSLPQFLNKRGLTILETIYVSRQTQVFRCEQKDGTECILKARVENAASLFYESRALSRFKHVNVVRCLGLFWNENVTFLQLEKAEGHPLHSLVLEKGPILEREAQGIFKQILSVLLEMKKNKHVHLDLRADNMIYSQKNQTLKLIDFESASEYSWRKLFFKYPNLEYSSPEARRGKFKGPEADIWSLGVTLFLILTAEFPFSSEDLLNHREELKLPSTLSANCQDLLRQLLYPLAKKRIKLESILNHPWLKGQTQKK